MLRKAQKVILSMLLEDPKTTGEIANSLRIQKSAIRTHLESLRAEQADQDQDQDVFYEK